MGVLLLHGFAINARSLWFPYLKRELRKQGIAVRAPNLPIPKLPVLDAWSYEMMKNVLEMKHPRIVVGHSLGGLTILRTLEETRLPIDLAIFVSAPIHLHAKRQFLKKFFRKRYRWARIRKNIKRTIVIHGKNDPLVPLVNAKEIAKQLHAKLVIVPKGGHFLMKKFPLLRDIIVREMKRIK